jgi:transposase
MRTKGSAAELEVKRRIAGNLLLAGKPRGEVARIVGTTWRSVNRWANAIRKGGLDALSAKPHPGRPSRLTLKQQRKVVRILERGALKSHFANDLWTCLRVAAVIERCCGVKYEESYVWRLLRKWHWSCQKPEHRAREQNRQTVEHWREVEWPRIKKGIPRES